MVCSQVYSQHPSHCVFSNVHQHRSWVPSNAEVHCGEPETIEANGFGNTTPDGHFLSSKGDACSGYASITSPFKSSWIQRLIPSHNTRVEQPQPLDKLIRENHHIDGLQTNWKENADHLTILGNQSVYENSRRSKQDFFSSHQTYSGTNTPECVQNGVNIRPFEAPNALPPEIQVSPKPLPIVESLLPGHSKKVTEYQTSTETNMPDILSRCTGLANPMKQTVHYSAYEKSRVSCSSIEGLYSRSVVCAAGDLPALKSLPMVKRCVGPSQPFSEFSFNSIGAVAHSNMDSTYDVKDRPSGPNIRTYMNSTQKTEDPFVTSLTESRYHDLHQGWASSVARCQSVEKRPLDGYSMLYREEAIETDQILPLGVSMDQLPFLKTKSRRNCCNPKEHHSYAHDGSEALYAREGSFDGGWWPISNTGKDEPRQISNLVPSHGGANVAKEKAGPSSSHHMIEQDLGSLHGSREEQGGTSRSFSFHFENRLASELDHPKVVTRKGQWPFGPSALSNEDLVQSRWSEGNRARGLAEATRPGLPRDNSSIFQETDVCEAGTAHIGRSQSSPFFGTENLNGSASHRISDNHHVSPYKAACIDIGEMNTQALSGSSVDQAGQTLQGGRPLSTLESDLIMEGMEGKELMLPFSSRTVGVKNWKAFRPSIQSSTRTCSPEGAQLNYADGNCVSENNGKAFKPPIRSSTYTCPPEGAQSNHADDNLCYSTGSIGSCSRKHSSVCSKDPSTSADARSRPMTQEKPSMALDHRESEGKEAVGWQASGLAVKQNIWLQRWSTMTSRKCQAVSRPNRGGGVLAGMTHARTYTEKGCCISQGSRESSHRFDLRPAKRVCYEKRSRLHPGNGISKFGSFAVGTEHNEKGVTSHFMKRFFTPSVAAMAIMGMTARKVHTTQPQRSGLFGVWASNASLRKPYGAQAEGCKEFLTRPNCEKEISQSAANAPPTSVDL